MSVPIDALSVIIRQSTLRAKYPGSVQQYAADCPNRTYCADAHLTRVGFLAPQDAQRFVGRLERLGLGYVRDGVCADIAVVDQVTGPIPPCEWLRFGAHAEGFVFAWLAETSPGALVAPPGWSPEGSRSMRRIDERELPERMFALGVEGTVEAHLDLKTGRILYAPPPGSVVPPEPASIQPHVRATPSATPSTRAARSEDPREETKPPALAPAGVNVSILTRDHMQFPRAITRFRRAIFFDRVAIGATVVIGLFHVVPIALLYCVPIAVYGRRVRYTWRVAPDQFMSNGPGSTVSEVIRCMRTADQSQPDGGAEAVRPKPALRWWGVLGRAILGPLCVTVVVCAALWLGSYLGVSDGGRVPIEISFAGFVFVVLVLIYSGLLKAFAEEGLVKSWKLLDPVSYYHATAGRR